MSGQPASPEQALLWVRWWVAGPRQADASWRLMDARIDPVLCAALEARSPAQLQHALLPSLAWPPAPDPRLLPLLALQPAHWARLLRLLVAVCAGNQPYTVQDLEDAELVWCRRLGRALQPGLWLPRQGGEGPASVQGLRLLQAWAGAPAWQRLRLQFDRALVEDAERLPLEGLPPRRLAALWQAVGWYALTITAQGSPHADPSSLAVESSPGTA